MPKVAQLPAIYRNRKNYRVVFLRVILGLTAFSILFGLIGYSRAPGADNAKSIAGRVFDAKAVPKKVQARTSACLYGYNSSGSEGEHTGCGCGWQPAGSDQSCKVWRCGEACRGATFLGNFVLANKGECNAWILIRSDAADSYLPTPVRGFAILRQRHA